MALESMGPRGFWAAGGPRRRYAAAGYGKPGDRAVPSDPPAARLAQCPAAILDSAPDGSGLGIWVLVESDEVYCTYEYAGGIA